MHLLIVEGERRSQKCYWNTCKCAPNPALVSEVHKTYTKDAKSRVNTKRKKEKQFSFEEALAFLKKLGWEEVRLKKHSGYKTTEESYDLTVLEVLE